MDFQIDYKLQDDKKKEKKLTLIVQAINQNHISRKGYWTIAAVDPNLKCEWIISDHQIKITKNMNQKIPITSINILIILISYESNFTESFNILDSKIIEII